MRILWPHNFNPDKPNSLVYLNTIAQGLRAQGVEVHFEYLGNLRSVPSLIKARTRLKQISRNYDLAHAQYGSACALVTAAIDDIPKVISIRGNDWNVHNESLGFLFLHTRLARIMSKLAIPRFDCVLAVSNRIATELKRCFPGKRIEILPSAIDLDKFVPAAKSLVRSKLGYQGNSERWILFNALNLRDPIKRYKLARQAFDIANQRVGNLRLQVANNCSHDQLPDFVAACDLILCTSETEGWPNSVKEALACNVPFVATDISDLGEIANREPACRICPPDAVALADAMIEVLEQSHHPDLRTYVVNMRLDISSESLIGIYESLLRDRQPIIKKSDVEVT